jgi:hypothetical protein
MAGIQRRIVAPFPPGESKTVLKRRFISVWSVPSSRRGSQRTTVMAVPPGTEKGRQQLPLSMKPQSVVVKYLSPTD